MHNARPLPSYLKRRYETWRETKHHVDRPFYRRLADDGQHPREMVISCSDSRVHVTEIFDAASGELFVHRNVAGLVPPYRPNSDYHGTSAALEYAVKHLRVAHVIVLGHSNCGGVQSCYEMCEGRSPEMDDPESFVGRWMDILRPGHDRLPQGDDATRGRQLEKEAVLVSLSNLMSFPFVQAEVRQDRLSIHGLWVDIAEGTLEAYDPPTKTFVNL